jgi:hypothetical protein
LAIKADVVSGKWQPVEKLRAQAREFGWPVVFDPDLNFDGPGLRRIIDLWQAKRGPRALPARSDFSARDLKSNLSRILLFEAVVGPRYRIRLMGSALTQVWGDLTGKFVDEAVPPHLQPRWIAFIEGVLTMGRPLRMKARVDFMEKTFLVAEFAAVPLSDDAGQPTMVMAAIHASSDHPWKQVGKVLLSDSVNIA